MYRLIMQKARIKLAFAENQHWKLQHLLKPAVSLACHFIHIFATYFLRPYADDLIKKLLILQKAAEAYALDLFISVLSQCMLLFCLYWKKIYEMSVKSLMRYYVFWARSLRDVGSYLSFAGLHLSAAQRSQLPVDSWWVVSSHLALCVYTYRFEVWCDFSKKICKNPSRFVMSKSVLV